MSKESEEGTTRPPLVLFGRYGSNHHCVKAIGHTHQFIPADTADARARRVKKKPSLLGYSTRNGSKAAREQEQKWIDLCLDHPKNQHHSS